MTAREIAEKTWELWNDYYKDGDLGSKEILDIIENDIKALTIPDVVDTEGELLAFSKFLLNRSYVRGKYYPETLVKLFKGK